MIIGVDIRSMSGGAYTGVGEYTINVLKHMVERATDVKFKLFFNAYNLEPGVEFSKDKIETHFFNYPNKYFSFKTRFFNRPKIDKMIGGADVFFSPHFISAPVSRDCKRVVTFHDLSFERYPEFFDLRRKFWHFSNNPRAQARDADHIIAVSESTAYDLQDIYGIDKNKISVVYSGVSEEFFKEISDEDLGIVRVRHNLPARFILFISTIEPRKNVLGIIKAFEIFKESTGEDVSLVIAGKPGWLHKKVFRAMRDSKYNENIKYIGFIKNSDKPALYRLSEVFVYPSIYEGFGFPPIEAMASGIPVITSARSSLPEVVEEAALLVDPLNVSDIAWMMEELIGDKKLAQSLSIKGLAQARKFTWQKCAQETLDILQAIY